MSDPTNVTGRWEGFYTQHEEQRPIAAQLTQQGARLTGEMVDGWTEIESSISEVAVREGLPPGADEQIVAKIRADHPEAPLGSVFAETQLPPHSLLEGEVEGRNVRFLKTYQGEHFAGFRIGTMRLRWKVDGHRVQYQGIVSPDGTQIEGHWRIQGGADPAKHAIRTEGGFLLRRTAAAIAETAAAAAAEPLPAIVALCEGDVAEQRHHPRP
jgi:hypothetical protein